MKHGPEATKRIGFLVISDRLMQEEIGDQLQIKFPHSGPTGVENAWAVDRDILESTYPGTLTDAEYTLGTFKEEVMNVLGQDANAVICPIRGQYVTRIGSAEMWSGKT